MSKDCEQAGQDQAAGPDTGQGDGKCEGVQYIMAGSMPAP